MSNTRTLQGKYEKNAKTRLRKGKDSTIINHSKENRLAREQAFTLLYTPVAPGSGAMDLGGALLRYVGHHKEKQCTGQCDAELRVKVIGAISYAPASLNRFLCLGLTKR